MGLPGSGKTTWVRAALETMGGDAVTTRDQFEVAVSRRHAELSRGVRWAKVAAFPLIEPTVTMAVARYLASFGGPGRPDRMRHGYRLLRHLHNHDIFGPPATPLLLDQGTVQQLWAIAMLSVPRDRAVRRVVCALHGFLPTWVVWVRVEPALALDRMRRRLSDRGYPDGDFEERADTIDERDFARADLHLRQIMDALQRAGVRTLEVGDTAGDEPGARLQAILAASFAER